VFANSSLRGLTAISDLFAKEPKSELENVVLDAFVPIFEKLRSSPKQPRSSFIFFTALESILLLNESEAITQNIGERLAFLVGSDADSRLRVKKVVSGGLRCTILLCASRRKGRRF